MKEERYQDFRISGVALIQIEKLAKATGKPPVSVIKIGVGLAKLAIEAQKKGYRLAITDSCLEPVKEILIEL